AAMSAQLSAAPQRRNPANSCGLRGFTCGRSRTRTCDLTDVNRASRHFRPIANPAPILPGGGPEPGNPRRQRIPRLTASSYIILDRRTAWAAVGRRLGGGPLAKRLHGFLWAPSPGPYFLKKISQEC